jgi:hypothetical protein
MKKQIAAFVATALVASMSFAQSTSTATMPNQDADSVRGFRVSVVKPVLEVELKVNAGSGSNSNKENLEDSLGFALGYASLPVQSLGWTANLAYLSLKAEGSEVPMLRADVNVGYAFTSLVNVKGGLNLSKFTKDDYNDFKTAIGLQANVGFQITRNFGLDLGYTQMNQTAEFDAGTVDLKLSGFEVGLNGTF